MFIEYLFGFFCFYGVNWLIRERYEVNKSINKVLVINDVKYCEGK